MNGLQMLLKALGVNLDPTLIESEFHKLRILIPEKMAEAQAIFASIDARLAVIEAVLAVQSGETKPAGIGSLHSDRQN